MSGLDWAVVLAVVAVGATVQGSVGFGLNLISAPVLAIIDPIFVPGPTLAAALVLVVLIGIRDRASMDLRGVGWAVVGRVPGSVAGAMAVAFLPAAQMSLAFAAAVGLAVILSARGWDLERTPVTTAGAGALSGVMGTVSSIGGPPMALVYQRSAGAELRGTLAGFFTFGATLSLTLLAIVGRFGPRELRTTAILVPSLVVGFVISRWTAPILDRGRVRPAVLLLSGGAAVGVVLRTVL